MSRCSWKCFDAKFLVMTASRHCWTFSKDMFRYVAFPFVTLAVDNASVHRLIVAYVDCLAVSVVTWFLSSR